MRRSAVDLALLVLSVSLFSCSRTQPEAKKPDGPLVMEVDVPMAATPIAAGEMRPGRQFGQTFVCKNNGLTRVEVLVATYAAEVPSGVLKIHLRASVEEQGDIASISVPANTIKDNSYVALGFPSIRDSGGRSYYVMLEAQSIPMGYGLAVWRSEKDVYPEGMLYVDGQRQPQDVCFRAVSTR
ncbi:MAG: hypothetical protein Q8Q12_00910 [bacterium]|nr:hypothetical protein [bacterium]